MTNWDSRFLALAASVATWSKDPSTQAGAVIVRVDRTIAGVGYNGFPRGCNDDPALYADRPTKLSRIVHAEMNAIISAGNVKGCTLYIHPLLTCDRCAVCMIQAGIKRVVYRKATPEQESRWGESFAVTRALYSEAGIVCEEISNGLTSTQQDNIEKHFGGSLN